MAECKEVVISPLPQSLENRRIGFFAYGSGCVAEFFSGVVKSGYEKHLCKNQHLTMLQNRKEIDYNTYEKFYNFKYPKDGERVILDFEKHSKFVLSEVNEHKRKYRKI